MASTGGPAFLVGICWLDEVRLLEIRHIYIRLESTEEAADARATSLTFRSLNIFDEPLSSMEAALPPIAIALSAQLEAAPRNRQRYSID